MYVHIMPFQMLKETHSCLSGTRSDEKHLLIISSSITKHAVGTLKEKRRKPQDQKIRELLSAYYTMQQEKNESVADFAHRFSEVQHQLEKWIPNVHKTPDGSEIELIHAFVLKVRPDTSKELVSEDFSVFKTLQAVVEAAQKYEVHTQSTVIPDVSSWKVPAADCQISHVKQVHRPNSVATSNLMNSGTKLKPQGQYVSKQASSQSLRSVVVQSQIGLIRLMVM